MGRSSIHVAVLVVLAAAVITSPVAAQGESTQFGIGYAANAPLQLLGVSGHVVFPHAGGIGLYLDAKMPRDRIGSRSSFRGDVTVERAEQVYGDRFFREEDSWRTVNGGLVRPVTPALMVYAGAGASERTRYVEYQDTTGTRGERSFYWVEDPDRSGTEINVLIGAFFRISRIVLVQLGFETAPRGLTVGGSFGLRR